MSKIVVLLLVFFSFLLSNDKEDDSLLPPNGILESLEKFDDLQQFTQADLYGYINGGAEVFLEFGFEQLTVQDYRFKENELSVEIYRMKDQVAATGIYLMKCGKEKPDTALDMRNTVNPYQILFYKDRFFVKIANHSGNSKNLTLISQMAEFIGEKLPKNQPIPEYAFLPGEGMIENSIRLIRGPFTLQSIFTFGEGDILMLGGEITAIAADYESNDKDHFTRIIIDYPDQDATKKAVKNFKANLDPYLKIVQWNADTFLLKDYEDKYVTGKIVSNRLDIKLNLKEMEIR